MARLVAAALAVAAALLVVFTGPALWGASMAFLDGLSRPAKVGLAIGLVAVNFAMLLAGRWLRGRRAPADLDTPSPGRAG